MTKTDKTIIRKLSEEHKRKISESHKGKIHSEETKRKISLAKKGKTTWMKGKKHTEESKHKMSKAHKGKKLSEEHKRKISMTIKGKNHPFYGKHHSEETKQKISLANLGNRAWNKGLTKETDERVKKYGNSQKGRRFSDEHKEKLCKARRKRIYPTKDTSIEIAMQEGLKKRGIPFKTHILLLEKYRPDVFIKDNLIIECDGDYWHRLPHIIKLDYNRDQELKMAGYQVLRFWEHEVKNDLETCLDRIMTILGER